MVCFISDIPHRKFYFSVESSNIDWLTPVIEHCFICLILILLKTCGACWGFVSLCPSFCLNMVTLLWWLQFQEFSQFTWWRSEWWIWTVFHFSTEKTKMKYLSFPHWKPTYFNLPKCVTLTMCAPECIWFFCLVIYCFHLQTGKAAFCMISCVFHLKQQPKIPGHICFLHNSALLGNFDIFRFS